MRYLVLAILGMSLNLQRPSDLLDLVEAGSVGRGLPEARKAPVHDDHGLVDHGHQRKAVTKILERCLESLGLVGLIPAIELTIETLGTVVQRVVVVFVVAAVHMHGSRKGELVAQDTGPYLNCLHATTICGISCTKPFF